MAQAADVDTDAITRDWVEDWQAPAMSERLASVKVRVGKEMVHLSYNRLDVAEDEKGWLVLGIGPEIIGAFAKFATELSDDLVPGGWRDRAYAGTVPSRRSECRSWRTTSSDRRTCDFLTSRRYPHRDSRLATLPDAAHSAPHL